MVEQELKFPNLEALLEKYGDVIISLYRQQLLQSNTDATGALGNDLNYIVETQDGDYELSLDLLDYWKYVEDGRAAGKYPPLNSIRSWIRSKRIVPRMYNGKLPTQEQLAYLIARKIHLQGTRGKHLLSNALDIMENNYMQILEESVTEDLQSQVDNYVFKNF